MYIQVRTRKGLPYIGLRNPGARCWACYMACTLGTLGVLYGMHSRHSRRAFVREHLCGTLRVSR